MASGVTQFGMDLVKFQKSVVKIKKNLHEVHGNDKTDVSVK